jgi:crossover junction endodeoxyribonuclease RuvC
MRVLGIDPGLRITGFAIAEARPGSLMPTLVEAGAIKLNAKDSVPDRLAQLHEELTAVVRDGKPQRAAVEQLFAHYAHPRTAIIMGHARGVILLTLSSAGLPIEDLPATEVKRAITGNGHAPKRQVQEAVAAQCGLDAPPEPPDVADAIAIALCAARRIALAG